MALLAPFGRYRALDNNGNPLNGGLLYTYEAGTSTPKDTFTDASENTKNDNPVVLDANGYADVWLESGSYKFVLKDSSDVTLWTTDDISSGSGGSYANSVVVQSTNLNLTSVYEGNLIVCDTALTITLLPAATAQDGFVFIVKNTSSGNVTIDPDGAETIDGLATLDIKAGLTANIVSDGTGWVSFGIDDGVSSLNGTSITTATVATDDKILIQDTDDSDNLKTVTAQSIADLAGTGSVLQIVNQTFNKVSLTTSTYTDIMDKDFTPLSDTSTIFIFASTGGAKSNASAAGSGTASLRIRRDTTVVQEYFERWGSGGSEGFGENITLITIDNPSTTSTVNYNVQAANDINTVTIDYNSDVKRTGNTVAGANMILVEVEI